MEFKVKSLSSTKITIHRESIPAAKTSQKKTGGSKKLKTKPFELRINLDNTSSSGSRKSVSKKSATRKSSCRKSASSKSVSTKSASLQNHLNGVTEHVTVKSENDFVASRDVIVKTEPAWDEGYGVSATSDSSVCNGESSHLEAFPALATIKSEVDCAFDIENATIVQMNVEPDADIHADIFGYKTEGERGENFEPGLVIVKSEPDVEYPMDVSRIKTEPELDLQSYSQDDMLLDPAVGYTFDHMYYCRVGDNSSVTSNLQVIKTESNQSVDDRTEENSETETDDDFELEIDLADEILEEVDQDKSEDYVPSSEESDDDDLKERMARSKKWKDDEDLSLPIRFGHVPSGAVKEETGGSGKNSLDTPDAENMCGVCGTVFSTTVECMEHIKSQHQYKGLYACLFCNQVFSVGNDLLQHEMWHREQGMLKSFRCIECGEVFTHLQSLMNHMRMHTGNKVYNCPNCDKVFTQAYTLTMHRRLHTVKRDHVCKECGASFHRPGYLKHHMRKHTGERPFVCKECSKTFSNSSNLSAHIRTHTGEKPYKCSECLASFATSSALTVHRWRHTDNRPFKCEECEKMFTTANTYKRHKLMHVGRKDYQCSVCGKKFSQKSSLTIHMRVHTGHRPFFCTECGATFTQSAHLTVHVRKHTGERPFACKECDKAFPRSEYLLRHKRNVHGHLIPKVNRH